jgi:hypothetical protein
MSEEDKKPNLHERIMTWLSRLRTEKYLRSAIIIAMLVCFFVVSIYRNILWVIWVFASGIFWGILWGVAYPVQAILSFLFFIGFIYILSNKFGSRSQIDSENIVPFFAAALCFVLVGSYLLLYPLNYFLMGSYETTQLIQFEIVVCSYLLTGYLGAFVIIGYLSITLAQGALNLAFLISHITPIIILYIGIYEMRKVMKISDARERS